MIISCEQCQAKFKVAPAQIKESGSKVRCSNCQHIFTVYRPQLAPPQEKEPPFDLLSEARPARAEDGLNESLARLLSEADEGPGDYKARRERRRHYYSDLEDEPGKAAADDSTVFFDDEDDSGDQPPTPPLRRAGRERREANEAAVDKTPPPSEDNGENDDELPPPLEERNNKDALGLGSDPLHREGSAPREAQGASIRAAAESSGQNPKIFLALAIVATALLVGIYFMANRPEPTALSGTDQTAGPADPAAPPAPAQSETEAGSADTAGTMGITFSKNNQNHYFRDNVKEGKILIITGMVRNSYPARRSFIHLRGRLVSADGSTLADRYAYAGNLLSEEDLVNLPISEIFTRLSIKSGQNNQNMNIEPGREVPFMLVFDKLPDSMTEYRIDPMGSTPSQ